MAHITPVKTVAFHGSPQQAVVSNPSAGVGTLIFDNSNTTTDQTGVTHPATGRRYQLLGVNFTLVTSATAATRIARVQVFDATGGVIGTNNLCTIHSTTNHLASTTLTYNFVYGLNQIYTQNGFVMHPLPKILLSDFQRFQINIVNVQAGDQLSSIRYYFEYWFDRV